MATHRDQTQSVWHTWIESTDIKPNRSGYTPKLVPPVRLQLLKYGGSDNAQWISRKRWSPCQVLWELYGMVFSEISRICEFYEFILIGIMTGLLGHCLWSILGLRVNNYGKTLVLLKGLRPVLEGFVVTMHEGACETGSQIPRALALGIWRTVRTSPSALWQQTPTDRS